MKTHILKSLMITLTVSLSFTACDKPMDLTEDGLLSSQTSIVDDIDLPIEEEYPSKLIATIQKDGHEVKFHTTGSPENPGIFMEELLYGRALQKEEEHYLANDETGSNPFDAFVAITDQNIPVPKAIANSAKDNLLNLSRRSVQENNKPLELLDASFSEEAENSNSRGCNGDVGYSLFTKWYCGSSQWWNIKHCHAHKRTGALVARSVFQNKIQKHHNSRVRVINCGTGTSNVLFYSWVNGKWQVNKIQPVGQGNRYQAHWVSNRAQLRVVIFPDWGTEFRSLINFVK